MTTPIQTVKPLLLACLAALVLLCGAAVAGAEVHYTQESMHAYEQQLNAGQIKSATFNKRLRSLHLLLKDGRYVKVFYPPKDEPTLAAQLTAHHIPVSILKPAQAEKEKKALPVHHKLRYIVGGIVLAIVVVVAIVLLVNRRRQRVE